MNFCRVRLSKGAQKDLKKVPLFIAEKFHVWVNLIQDEGLLEARKIKSFHDEPLKGDRKGQRSIRLNKAYRAIYIELLNGNVELIEVLEVNKHEY